MLRNTDISKILGKATLQLSDVTVVAILSA